MFRFGSGFEVWGLGLDSGLDLFFDLFLDLSLILGLVVWDFERLSLGLKMDFMF